MAGLLFGIGGALIVVFFVFVGCYYPLKNAGSQEERNFLWKMIGVTSLFVMLPLILQFCLNWFVPMPYELIGTILMWVAYVALLIPLMNYINRRTAELKSKHETK